VTVRWGMLCGVGDPGRTIATGAVPTFGRADAVDQAAAMEAVRAAATNGSTVVLPAPTGTGATP
jgi:hypothetical protein